MKRERTVPLSQQEASDWICGIHSVEETFSARSGDIFELWVESGIRSPVIDEMIRFARRLKILTRFKNKDELLRVTEETRHQGVAARVRQREAGSFLDFLKNMESANEEKKVTTHVTPGRFPKDFGSGISEPYGPVTIRRPESRLSEGLPLDCGLRRNDGREQLQKKKRMVLVALDQIQDPHNFGAIARSASVLGAQGLIIPDRRSASVSSGSIRASAGAIQKIPIYQAANLGQALLRAKELGFWIYGASAGGRKIWESALNCPMIIVVGSEGVGLRKSIEELCDEVVGIPISDSGVSSLNASVAASILLYETLRRKEVKA